MRRNLASLTTVHRILDAIPGGREAFWDTFMNCVHNNPAALQPIVSLIAMYAHLGPFSRKVIAEVNKRLAALDQPGAARVAAGRPMAAAAWRRVRPCIDLALTMTQQRVAPGFDRVETWVFDLDNTLYPHHLNLWQQVDERIRAFVADFLKVSKDEAFRLQKDYYKRYGTTMRGLMTEHGMNPDDYLEYVHQIDHSPLVPNPALGAALERLPGRKLILTNGTRKHAEAVMRAAWRSHHHFEDVFDIAAADLDPKPLPQVYERFLKRHDVDPRKSAMFEDLARNLAVPHALGMITVLVVPEGQREVFREAWELEGRDAPHIDYVTENIVDFIERICGGLRL